MMKFPTEWKNKIHVPSTNQIGYHPAPFLGLRGMILLDDILLEGRLYLPIGWLMPDIQCLMNKKCVNEYCL